LSRGGSSRTDAQRRGVNDDKVKKPTPVLHFIRQQFNVQKVRLILTNLHALNLNFLVCHQEPFLDGAKIRVLISVYKNKKLDLTAEPDKDTCLQNKPDF